MWPFKKHLPIADLNDKDDSWSVLEATTADGLMLVRMNTSAKRWAKHPSLGIRVGFAIPFVNPDADKEALAFENAALNRMEEQILSCLKADGPAIHVLTITTGTFKEFVFYVQEGAAIANIHERVKAETPSHDVQCMAVHDAQWALYSSFSK